MRNSSPPTLFVRALAQLVAPLLVILAFALWPQSAYAATITVDGATCTLPDAITAANLDAATDGCTAGNSADTLVLTASTYSLATGPYDFDGLTATPSVTSTIVISGGIDGAIVERSGSNHYRLFHVGKTGDLTLQNVVVRHGQVDGHGGAIFNQGTLTLLDCQIISNTAGYDGGGIFSILDSTLTLTNSDFIFNIATKDGGGIYNGGGAATITSSDFTANTADNGGGMYNNLSTLTITNSSFSSNVARSNGGGLYHALYGTARLTGSDFTSNSASVGAGLYVDKSAVIVSGAHFASNMAGYGGGIYADSGGTVTLDDSSFTFNTASSGAGFLNNGTTTLSNCEFNANTADAGAGRISEGGGLRNFGTATVTNCKFIANTASGGGGLYNGSGPGISMSVADSVFISNTAYAGAGLYNFIGATTVTNSYFIANTATIGGGIANNFGTITLTNSEMRANLALKNGGALYQQQGMQTTIFNSRLLDNKADDTGGALQILFGSIRVTHSCIIHNTDTSVESMNGSVTDVANNWWGAADGPSGAGSGAGDSISNGVTFSPFLTSSIMDCPSHVKGMLYLPHLAQPPLSGVYKESN